jgi:hypothetical protein
MGRLAKNPEIAPAIAQGSTVPGGVTGLRPADPADGSIRYNDTNSALEYWDGVWQQFGKTGLTTVVVDSLTGANGIKVLFQSGDGVSQSIAAATDVLIFIGGVYQIPTTNYSVSGTDITFTSPPPNLESVTVVHNLNQVT